MNLKKSKSALSLIDEIISCLCREGPAKDRTYALIPSERVPDFNPVSPLLGWHKVQSRSFPGMVLYDIGSLVVPHALKLARASLEVLYDGVPKVITLDYSFQFSAFSEMMKWRLEDFVQNAKYATAYPMAKFLRQADLPNRPPSFTCNPFVYTGKIKRILKNRCNSFSKSNASLMFGYLQGVKRGAETVPESFVHNAMLKHKKTLSSPAKFNWSEQVDLEDYFVRFFKHFPESHPRLYEASTAASYEYPRSKGGARQFITDDYLGRTSLSDDTRAFYELQDSSNGDLLGMYESRPGLVHEVKGHYNFSSYSDLKEDLKFKRDVGSLHSNVMVSAVLEPLKVRLITKGESSKYYLSRFFQKEMWSYLQRYPQFALTGRPLLLDDFYSLLEREKKLGLDFNLWVSGDYSAATDNLKSIYTKSSFEECLNRSNLDDDSKTFLREVLYEQVIHYPNAQNKTGDLDPFVQQTGQLMGSTLSFPILCAVNFCTYWRSLESFLGRRIAMKDLPVLINGDDILFRTIPGHYSLWKEMVSEVGFDLSVGKNYVHPSIFTINSECFSFIKETQRISQVGYLNVGLLTGQSKLGNRSMALAPIWDYYNVTLEGATDKLRAHKRFLHYHRENIQALTQSGNYSLFSHPLLGGLGFKLFPSVESSVHFTPFQRRFGSFLNSFLTQPYEGEFEKLKPFRGLVKEKTLSKSLFLEKYHYAHYEVRPKIGPLRENERSVLSSNFDGVYNMATSYSRGDRPEVLIRHPDRQILEGFRSQFNPELRRTKLLSFNHQFVEILAK